MKKNFIVKFTAALSSMALLMSIAGAPRAADSANSDALQTSFTLYVWAPSMDGKLKYGTGGDGDASVDGGDILNALQMAFMGALEVRKNRWSMLADVIYLDLADDKVSRVGLPGGDAIEAKVDLELSGWQVGLYGGYNLYHTEIASLDLLAGARYLQLDGDTKLTISGPLPPSLPSARLSSSSSIWDAVIGFRGRVELNPNWFVPYHVDVGAGDSDLTWQVMAGIGYQAGWGDLMLIYRHLEWDEGNDQFLQGLSFSGPAIAFRYRF
jgi:hypothetical protein